MSTANTKTINIGMGELAVSKDPSSNLACIGLGSCIALCIWDPFVRLGGIAHMLLPTSCRSVEMTGSPAKYINSGVPNLINRMIKNGASRYNFIIKIAGGARMLSIPGENNVLDIGQRNITEIRAILKRENLRIVSEDVGGISGRSLHLSVDTGRIVVRSLTGRVIEL